MREIWESIPGWEGLYVVSNLARVKHLSEALQTFRKNGMRNMT